MALAAMTESPMAVTCLPVILAGMADGVGVPTARLLAPGEPVREAPVPEAAVPEAPVREAAGPGVAVPADGAEGDACAWVAALTRSPSEICRSIPAGAAA